VTGRKAASSGLRETLSLPSGLALSRYAAMVYELLDHTADVRLRVRGSTREEVFTSALRGLMHVLGAAGDEATVVRSRRVRIESEDLSFLLVDFLNEALWLAHVHRESYDEVRFSLLDDRSVEAELSGHRVVSFTEDVKAVTYHEADVREHEGGWETTLVLDV
jgi:SHS2 domain-containing protein